MGKTLSEEELWELEDKLAELKEQIKERSDSFCMCVQFLSYWPCGASNLMQFDVAIRPLLAVFFALMAPLSSLLADVEPMLITCVWSGMAIHQNGLVCHVVPQRRQT